MPTIKEIAKSAGVSIGTVSNVLNGLSSVREPARLRVTNAIERLGYQPSMLGRALRKDKSNMIVMIVPDITNPFFPGAVRGAEDVAFKHAYRLVLCNSDNDFLKEATYIREMQTYRPSGLIIVPADLNRGLEEVKAYLKAGAGVIYVDRIPPNWHGNSVTSAHEQGAIAATRHLIELGHKRIATITGPRTATSAVERLKGFRKAMASAELPVRPGYVQESEFNKAAGHAKAVELLRMVPRPTAIFAGNDLIAFGVLAAIREAKLRCPSDISVVGYDNLDEGDSSLPALTTVDQFSYQIGVKAAEMVVAKRHKRDGEPRKVVLSPVLRVKESTAPPPPDKPNTSRPRRRR
jgi:LacI family transcriptional regulator, galactose operon repressor